MTQEIVREIRNLGMKRKLKTLNTNEKLNKQLHNTPSKWFYTVIYADKWMLYTVCRQDKVWKASKTWYNTRDTFPQRVFFCFHGTLDSGSRSSQESYKSRQNAGERKRAIRGRIILAWASPPSGPPAWMVIKACETFLRWKESLLIPRTRREASLFVREFANRLGDMENRSIGHFLWFDCVTLKVLLDYDIN